MVPEMPFAGALLLPFPYCTFSLGFGSQSNGAGRLPQHLLTMSPLAPVKLTTAYIWMFLTNDSRLGVDGADSQCGPTVGPVVLPKSTAGFPLLKMLVVGLATAP